MQAQPHSLLEQATRIAYALFAVSLALVFGYVAWGLADFSNAGSAWLSAFSIIFFGTLIGCGASVVLAPASFAVGLAIAWLRRKYA